MNTISLFWKNVILIILATILVGCGGGGSSTPTPTPTPPTTTPGPYPSTGEGGGGGGNSYLSSFRTTSDRTLLRKRLAARTFLIPEAQVDALVNYSYNDWGEGSDCAKGGNYGGHAGIDYQTKSVTGTATTDVPIYSISAGTLTAYQSHSWGITAIVKSRVRNASSGQDQDIYIHYLHLRTQNTALLPGDLISVGSYLGVQGSLTPSTPNNAEHVHIELALQALDYGHGAHPDMCNDAIGVTLDPYPLLAGLTETSSQSPILSLTSDSGMSVQTNQAYGLNFYVTDADSNLSHVDLNWNDGTAVERKNISGASGSLTFTRLFASARTISWSATAYDTSTLSSTMLQGSFTVTNATPTPLTCSGQNGGVYSTGQTEYLGCPAGTSGNPYHLCQASGSWGSTIGVCTTNATCTGVNGGSYSPGQSETISCPAGTTGSQTHTCQQDGTWGSTTGMCPANITCAGVNGGTYYPGQNEYLGCPSGTTGNPYHSCLANGTWSSAIGSCITNVVTCTGFNGGTYTSGQTETLSCPAGTNGSQTHICQSNGSWSSIAGICTTPPPTTALTNAAKTGNLSKLWACPSGSTGCVQAGITLTGSNLLNFDKISITWNGTTGSGSAIFLKGNSRIVSGTDTQIVLWPTVFDQTDPTGTCATWSFSVTKGSTTTSTLDLSTGQICRPPGI